MKIFSTTRSNVAARTRSRSFFVRMSAGSTLQRSPGPSVGVTVAEMSTTGGFWFALIVRFDVFGDGHHCPRLFALW